MNMKTRYVVKGIGKEQTIASIVNIYLDDKGKISKVEDKWDGKLPESGIANVSFVQLLSPFWWFKNGGALLFWLWSFVWYTRVWLVGDTPLFVGPIDAVIYHENESTADSFFLQAFRRLNANTVPWIVGVPKNKEEDAKKGN